MAKIYRFPCVPKMDVMKVQPDFRTGRGRLCGVIGRFVFGAVVCDKKSRKGFCGGRIMMLTVKDMDGNVAFEFSHDKDTPSPKAYDERTALRTLIGQLEGLPLQRNWDILLQRKEGLR